MAGYILRGKWDGQPSQKSQPITLKARRPYYFEALHKQGGGEDFLSVGWRLPDGAMERPIPSSRLASYDGENGCQPGSAQSGIPACENQPVERSQPGEQLRRVFGSRSTKTRSKCCWWTRRRVGKADTSRPCSNATGVSSSRGAIIR